jgi:PAS domain S-box-containing protein
LIVSDTGSAVVLASEHQALLEFLYRCPYGLAQFDDGGTISLCNPAFACLAQPLLPVGGMLINLVEVLSPVVPTLPNVLQNPIGSGTLCDGLRVHLEPPYSGREAGVLSLTIVRMAPNRHMALLSDITQQVAQERRLRESEDASTRARIAEAENRALEERIREQERTKEVLHLSEMRFRRLFESSSAGILIVDTSNGLILDANPSMIALLEHERVDVVGRTLWDIGAFEALVVDEPGFETLQKEHYRRFHDVPLRTRTGAMVDVELTSLVYSDDGKERVQVNVQDITERKATNRLVVHAQKMTAVGILTGGLAHNINNLLAVIVANLDFLQEKVADDDAGSEYVREAQDAAMHGGALISSMLAFAREQPLRSHKIDVSDTVAKIANTFGAILGDGITMLTQFDDETCWPVLSDQAQLEASILNLITNAREAMPAGGLLTLSVFNRRLAITQQEILSAIPGEYVEISVTDTGSGMSAETIEQIFEPFFTTKGLAAKQGTGLGLSTVFGFARQSGGDIAVESVVSEGTTFRLRLPRSDSEVSIVETPVARRTKDGHETILVVEDNDALSRVVARHLTRLGYKVLQAKNSVEALTALRAGHVDLLFTDIALPGEMGGLEIAQVARDTWPSLKVVLTTGFEDAANRADTRDLSIIMKPYRTADLGRTLRDVLDEVSVG